MLSGNRHILIENALHSFHLNKPTGSDTRKFMSLLDDHDLVQHVKGPTHIEGIHLTSSSLDRQTIS